MLKQMLTVLVLLCFLCLAPIKTGAQEKTETPTPEEGKCPSIVEEALIMTREECDATSTNEACNGHPLTDAQLRPGTPRTMFDETGEIVDIFEIVTLQLSAMDEASEDWGVVLMEVIAVPTNGQATQFEDNVQILLFGDVAIKDSLFRIEVTAPPGVNIRTSPLQNSDVIMSTQSQTNLVANGRLEDSSWLRIVLPDDDDGLDSGWVFADLVSTDEDIDALSVVDASGDSGAVYSAMNSVVFQSGSDDAPCAKAPNSGMLIQTPEGVASVTIVMDEVVVQMNGTGFIQAQPGGNLTVNVGNGWAQVEANGETSTALAGNFIAVPINDELRVAGVPSDPAPYQIDTVANLPVSVLDDMVTIAPPDDSPQGSPFEGNWLFSWGVESAECPDGTVIPFESAGETGAIRLEEGGFTWHDTDYNQIATGVYTANYIADDGNAHLDTLQVIARDYVEGEKIIDLSNPICTLTVPFTLQLVSTLN